MIEKPLLKFSEWMIWEDRKKYHLKKYPGVYLIAITDKNLETKKFDDIDYNDVVYIGMTRSQAGLNGRWNQFHSSIVGKKYEGHSGGTTIYKDLGPYEKWSEKLFVSAMPFEINVTERKPEVLIKMGYISYLEYYIMAKFIEKTGKVKPCYNKQ